MTITHHVLVEGNSLSFRGGFFGFSTIALARADEHPPILFDTGHHCTRLLLLEALERHGLKPRDIGSVFLSHLHFDHANNIDLFPDATFHVSAVEVEYAARPAPGDVFCSAGTNAWLATRRLHLLHQPAGELVPGLHYRAAPGHTPGSYLLHYRRDSGERVVLAGDACKTFREIASLRSANVHDSDERATRTLRWIDENADIIVPGHYPELRRTPRGWTWDEPQQLGLIVR